MEMISVLINALTVDVFAVLLSRGFIERWERWRVPVLITLYSLSSLAIIYFASQFLLRFLTWPYVALLWPVLITACVVLWLRGKRLDREARNPLRDILPPPSDIPAAH